MKKVVLSAIGILLALCVNAQGNGNGNNGNGNGNGGGNGSNGNGNGNGNNGNGNGNGGPNNGSPSTSDNVDVILQSTISDWIDLNPEVSTLVFNPLTWNTLDDGWDLGTVNCGVSATRTSQVTISAQEMRLQQSPYAGTSTPGYRIPVNRLSAAFVKTGAQGVLGGHTNINSNAWTVAANFAASNLNVLSGSSNGFMTSTGGGHNVQFTGTFSAYKGLGHAPEHYYQDNLHGSTTAIYQGSVTLSASLIN